MRLFEQTNIDFIGKRKIFFIFSLVITIGGLLGSWIVGVDYGIDFEGGTEIGVEFAQNVSTHEVRSAIDKSFKNAEIKSYGKTRQYLVRVKDVSNDAPALVQKALEDSFPSNKATLLKGDRIGPKVGAELRRQAVIAVILSVIAILLYVAVRFEFIYGLGAVVALLHDVLVAYAAVVIGNKLGIINLEMNQNMIAAFLTVIGFSINDTVIIFDRIRENKEHHKAMPLIDLMNLSINETLSRTIITVVTVVMVLFVMVVAGGEVLQGFSFAMLIGILIGTYSSIYVASAFVIWYLENVKKENLGGKSIKAVKA